MIFSDLTPGLTVQGIEIPCFKTDIKAKRYLYLLAGTHGDEVEGVYVLQELFNWLKSYHQVKDLPMLVIPILNIDGYQRGTRINAHCVDLNRNYPSKDWVSEFSKDKYNPGKEPLSEPENIFLVNLFKKFKPGVILSFHSWKAVINFNGDGADIARSISQFNEYPISGDIGYATPGSLGTYVPEKYNCPVITFECPTLNEHNSLKSIWQENELALKNLFESDILRNKLQSIK